MNYFAIANCDDYPINATDGIFPKIGGINTRNFDFEVVRSGDCSKLSYPENNFRLLCILILYIDIFMLIFGIVFVVLFTYFKHRMRNQSRNHWVVFIF